MVTNNSWNSQDPAQVAKGGSGAVTLTGVLTGNGTSAFTGSAVTADKLIIGGASNAVSSTGINVDGSDNMTDVTSIVPAGDRAGSLGSASLSWDNVYADGLTFDDGTNVMANYVDKSTWSPVLSFGGASVGITYSFQNGDYIRIGNVVIFWANLAVTSKGTSTGIAGVSLPITASATNNNLRVFASGNTITHSTGCTYLYGYIPNGGTVCELGNSGSGAVATTLLNTNFANTSLISLSGSYLV